MHRYNIFLLALLFVGFAKGQMLTTSPYSSQGIGDVSLYGDAYFMGMAGITTVLADSSQTNMFNPSSYSLLARSLPLFSMGINYQSSTYEQGLLSSTSSFANVSHMALAIPFGKRWGMGFGIKPFARTGYEINSYDIVDGDSLFYDYLGKGEVYEFNLGFSYNLIARQKHVLSIGANGKHYFGKVVNRRMAYRKVNQQKVGFFDDDILNVASLGVDFGLTYKFNPNVKHHFVIGSTYQPQQDLNVRHGIARAYYGNLSNPFSYDTLTPYIRQNGTISIPSRFNIGFSYEFTPVSDSTRKRTKMPSLLLSGEYGIADWSNYTEDIPERDKNFVFNDMRSIRLGLQYTPHRNPIDRSAYVKFYEHWSYRFGLYSIDLPYQVDGESLLDNGMSFGITVPVIINRAASTINLAVNYGNRTTNNTNGVNERYLGAGFSFNISPSYDRWFRKYQLD